MRYAFQLDWGNSVLYHCYYQGLSNWIQDPISTWELFQDMYVLVMTINHHYWERDCNTTMQSRRRKRPLSLTPRSKEKLPPPVLPQPPRIKQIHL